MRGGAEHPAGIRCAGLTRRFGPLLAVDGLDLEVRPGEIIGFLGPNGAGKTTSLGMIAGLIEPSAGGAWLNGVDCRRADARRGVGLLVGPPGLWPGLSGVAHVEQAQAVARRAGRRGHWATMAAPALLERVGLAPRDAARPARQYSQGMRQRLGLAVALAADPVTLVLDEPTNGLDPLGGPEIWALLRECAEAGVAVLVSTHLLLEVERYCDRAPMIVSGRLVHGDVLGLMRGGDLAQTMVLDFLVPEAAAAGLGALGAAGFEARLAAADGTAVVEVSGLSPAQVPDVLRHLAGVGAPLPGLVRRKEMGLDDLFRLLAAATPPGNRGQSPSGAETRPRDWPVDGPGASG